MKRVYMSKNPTIKQLQNVSKNLRDHLKTFASISITSSSFSPGMDILMYGLYIESDGESTHQFKTWSELVQFYQKLIEGDG